MYAAPKYFTTNSWWLVLIFISRVYVFLLSVELLASFIRILSDFRIPWSFLFCFLVFVFLYGVFGCFFRIFVPVRWDFVC